MPRSRSTASRATRPRAASLVRVAEATGSSARSWDAAVTDAVREAKEAKDPIAVEVVRLWADLGPRGRLRTYRANVKVAYRQSVAR
ncbi:MAG: dodecin domain-containing protein [Candidatus Limnocylindria bacterium]